MAVNGRDFISRWRSSDCGGGFQRAVDDRARDPGRRLLLTRGPEGRGVGSRRRDGRQTLRRPSTISDPSSHPLASLCQIDAVDIHRKTKLLHLYRALVCTLCVCDTITVQSSVSYAGGRSEYI